jgi:hypothetical protein
MPPIPRALAGLALAALLTPAAGAAPAPGPEPASPALDRFAPDDTNFVLLVNVKQALASPLYTGNYQKPVEALLAGPAIPAPLKDLGFDPLKDVDRIVLFLGRSSHSDNISTPPAPVIVVRGRFRPAKLHEKLAGFSKDYPKTVQVHDGKGGKVYELRGPPGLGLNGFVAIPDGGTVILTGRKEQALEALARAAGKKRAGFKHRNLPVLLKGLQPDLAVQAVGLEDMIVGSSYSGTFGPGGGRETKVKHHTLGESGIKELRVAVSVKDVIKARVTLAGKGKAEVAALHKNITDGLNDIKTQTRMGAGAPKEVQPAFKIIESITVQATEQAVVLEGQAGPEELRAVLIASGLGRMFGAPGR